MGSWLSLLFTDNIINIIIVIIIIIIIIIVIIFALRL